MMQNRHSMAPMRREHAEIRRLVADFTHLEQAVGDKQPTLGRKVALRRVLFILYALLEVHLVEEEALRAQPAQDGPPAARPEVDGEVKRSLRGRKSHDSRPDPVAPQTMPAPRPDTAGRSSAFLCR